MKQSIPTSQKAIKTQQKVIEAFEEKKLKNNSQIQQIKILDSEFQELKRIKSVQIFFNKKFLGNKNQTKSVNKIRALKNNIMNEENQQKLFNMKTGNLITKIKQIQDIFKTEKKNRRKISLFKPELTAFQVYKTKRDIFKQKNDYLQQLRVINKEQKAQEHLSKTRGKKFNKNNIQILKQRKSNDQTLINDSKPGQNRQINKKQQNDKEKDQIQQIQEDQSQKNIKSETQDKQTLKTQSNIKKSEQKMIQPVIYDDDYFQKKFQQKINNTKYVAAPTTSIRNLIDPIQKHKTIFNKTQFLRNELSQIQNVAKNTISHFKIQQKINKDVFNQSPDEQNDYESILRSAMQSPTDFGGQLSFRPQKKSINWILNQCDRVKKSSFKVRKSKSLKVIKQKN